MSANSTSSLMQRMMLALRTGLSFGGARDYYQVFGYKRILTSDDLLGKYQRQDIAARVVDSPPDAVWAYPPSIVDNSAADDLWQAMIEKGLLQALLQADKLCAFDMFSVVWVGLPGKPDLPAQTRNVEDIAYFSAHGAGAVKIAKYEENPQSPRFGLPLSYDIRIDRPGVPITAAVSKNVHWSRVIHITDIPIQGRLFSRPRLEIVYNLLDDILKVAGSSAETFWLAANRGLQVDVDKEMTFGAGDAEALSAEMDEYQHQLRRVIRTRGVKVTNLGSDIADPTGTFSTLLALLASATSIPQRILMGAEAGQLASAQDRANWAEAIERRRIVLCEPYIIRPVFRHMQEIGLMAADQSKQLEVSWPEAFHQNPLEVSQTMSAKARALINLSRQSQYGTPYVGQKEGRVWLGLPPELPSDDYYPMAPSLDKTGKSGKAGQTEKQGGNKESGGAGGNDGTGDSGGGTSDDNNAPSADRTSAPTE